MTDDSRPAAPQAPPELPKRLADLVPPVVVVTAAWAVTLGVTLVLRYASGADVGLWPATAVAGAGLGLLGLAIVGWQRRASRRGTRGAQRGL